MSIAIITAITNQYTSIARQGFGIESEAGDYKQIFPPRWPKKTPSVHYEFIFGPLNGEIYEVLYGEIQLMSKNLPTHIEWQRAMTDIRTTCLPLISPHFSHPSQRNQPTTKLGMTFGFYVTPPATPAQIIDFAQQFQRFIDLTHESATNILANHRLLR